MTIAEEMAARDALRDLFGTQLHRTPIKHQQPIELHDTNFKENISIGQILEQGKLKTREEQKQIESWAECFVFSFLWCSYEKQRIC